MSEYNDTGGLTRILRAFGYSLQGFRACYRHEAAFRQEVAVALVAVPLGLWLGDGGVEKALLVGSWILVMIVELINSAITSTTTVTCAPTARPRPACSRTSNASVVS
ncbi:MAG: diacylglycerol kinase [Gammaproteobacteria bacterium]|nr:diacylglycerol kinase [Gammaproteobacteria bacterium]